MQVFLVGGAVRDRLLGLPAGDRDWVVLGSTPDAMLRAGYIPVGRDFPVFLHPQTREEYALARTERKTSPGYHGFVFHAGPEVTLEEDLARRDLTVNAMAEDAKGHLIDPWGGERDLRSRVLRHVSPAFAEDPVRILRLARFAARFHEFGVAAETRTLCRQMVEAGEVDALVPERVWQELARGLMEQRPSRMFQILHDCNALARVLPEVACLFGVPQHPARHPEIDVGVHLMMVLDMAARLQGSLAMRYACLCHDLGKGLTSAAMLPRHHGHAETGVPLVVAMSERLRVPNECRELAELVTREHGAVHASIEADAAGCVQLLARCDAWRRPQRFAELLLASECDARGRAGFEERPYPQRERLLQALALTQSIDQPAVVAEAQARGARGPEIAQALMQARVERLISHGWPAPLATSASDPAAVPLTNG
ncbi:MAG: multifunctional CCA addition/repair protein [Leptothrix sp. (in: b-proteobacteria)]